MWKRWELAAATLPEVRDWHGTKMCHHAGHGKSPVLHSNKAACDGLFCYPQSKSGPTASTSFTAEKPRQGEAKATGTTTPALPHIVLVSLSGNLELLYLSTDYILGLFLSLFVKFD